MKLQNNLAFILIFLSCICFGQKQAAVLHFGSHGLDFKCPEPSLIHEPNGINEFYVSSMICDSAGNIALMSVLNDLYNGSYERIPGSEDLKRIYSNYHNQILILPNPGVKDQYYVLVSPDGGLASEGLRYHLVDMTMNNGKGQVIKKNVRLTDMAHTPLLGTYDADHQRVWFIHLDFYDSLIYSSYLDKNGFHLKQKVASYHRQFKVTRRTAISPDGSIFFIKDDNYHYEFYSFNKSNGQIKHLLRWRPKTILKGDVAFNGQYGMSFSRDGKKLYISVQEDNLDKHNTEEEIISYLAQYDLSEMDEEKIEQSKKVLMPLHPYLRTKTITPGIDGKMYVFAQDTLYRINNPSLPCPDCNLTIIAPINYNNKTIGRFPNMVSSFFDHPPFLPKSKFQAIPDTTLCSGEVISIGNQTLPNTTYNWSPSHEVDDHEKASPVFTKVNKSDIPRISNLYLTAQQDNCLFKDTVKVTVNPDMSTGHILGSKSVCPYVEEVVYNLDNPLQRTVSWQVSGGDIISQEDNDIAVNWHDTNPNAWVSIKTESPWGRCNTQQQFPIKINVELDTETPRGNQTVCYNLRNDNQYEITNTNGSVYTWSLQGGAVANGQGTNQVQVSWHDNGNKALWVQEYSQTIDTVCYGNSDTLAVLVFTDTARVMIHAASVNMDSTIIIDGDINGNITFPVALHKQNDVETFSPRYLQNSPLTHLDHFVNPNDHAYYYQMNLKSTCELDIASASHRTMLLQSDKNEEEAAVNLHWNDYEGWPKGVLKYEIFRSVDEGSWEYFAETDQPEYIYSDGLAGIDHQFRIKAIEKDGINFSWSNMTGTSFDHELFIPNVFTPNQDQFNEYFEIKRLEVYPENYLKVYNRWGKEVLFVPNYQNNWNAAGLSSGMYYYELFIKRRNKSHTGYFQVVTQ